MAHQASSWHLVSNTRSAGWSGMTSPSCMCELIMYLYCKTFTSLIRRGCQQSSWLRVFGSLHFSQNGSHTWYPPTILRDVEDSKLLVAVFPDRMLTCMFSLFDFTQQSRSLLVSNGSRLSTHKAKPRLIPATIYLENGLGPSWKPQASSHYYTTCTLSLKSWELAYYLGRTGPWQDYTYVSPHTTSYQLQSTD